MKKKCLFFSKLYFFDENVHFSEKSTHCFEKIPHCTIFDAILAYLVIRIIGVTRNKDDANVRRWNRKIVNIMDPDATVKAPNVNRAIFVTSKSRDRPELPLRPALTLCPTMIRQTNTSLKYHFIFSIHIICHLNCFFSYNV